MTIETKIRTIGLTACLISATYFVAYVKDNEFNDSVKSPVNVEYFKKGDVLLPDYACSDTMIVVDAIGLNKDIALIEQGIIESSDSEIDSTFHLYCSVK